MSRWKNSDMYTVKRRNPILVIGDQFVPPKPLIELEKLSTPRLLAFYKAHRVRVRDVCNSDFDFP